MRTGYHSYCGCCGRPCHETAEWCDACEAHVGKNGGPPWERTHFALTGNPCMYEDYDGCGVAGIHGYCERPAGHDGPHSTTFWWRPADDPALEALLTAQEERLASTSTSPEDPPSVGIGYQSVHPAPDYPTAASPLYTLAYEAQNVIDWLRQEGHDGKHPIPCVSCQIIHHLSEALKGEVSSASDEGGR